MPTCIKILTSPIITCIKELSPKDKMKDSMYNGTMAQRADGLQPLNVAIILTLASSHVKSSVQVLMLRYSTVC